MADLIKVTENISVSGQPQLVQFLRLRNQGLRSVLNLCTGEEWEGALAPAQEKAKVSEFGLLYSHLPTPLSGIDAAVAARFARELDRQPAPKLVHCGDGQRSLALVLIALGVRAGTTHEDAFARAEELGCLITEPRLRELIETCLPVPEEEEEATSEKTAAGV